jgi:hypothetical protein
MSSMLVASKPRAANSRCASARIVPTVAARRSA